MEEKLSVIINKLVDEVTTGEDYQYKNCIIAQEQGVTKIHAVFVKDGKLVQLALSMTEVNV